MDMQEHADQGSSQRIVTLLASATEIVSALGAQAELVGRSHECDFPASVEALPPCSQPRFDPVGSSLEVDQRVKQVLTEALSVYLVDADKLKTLNPDVIVTQAQCEVCAVSEDDLQECLNSWTGRRPEVVTLMPECLADVWTDILNVGRAIGREAEAHALIDNCHKRICDITEQTDALTERPTVAGIEWIEPLMAGGNWMPELIDRAGAQNLFGEAGKHSPWMTFEELQAADPEVIVIYPCGYDIQQTKDNLPPLLNTPGWSDLRAVREGRVAICDGNHFFNRPGPRLVESLEILTEILYPGRFDYGHKGKDWVPLEDL